VFALILYISPSKVYTHTDYNTSAIEHAVTNGCRWTRKLMNTWPDLLVRSPVQVPNYAGPNEQHRIHAVQHKSDFIRWDTIAEYGGVYIDFDVVILHPLTPLLDLHPLTPLLDSGFAFVAGRQYGGKTKVVR
jgi:hypothetical protein